MALLPETYRNELFDSLSTRTMRYVSAVPLSKARGLTARAYSQIVEDFFINGSLTSRSKVPNLLAAIWSIGRETILVEDALDKVTKEAMAATLSSVNDCPYCGEMLVSLVHAGDKPEVAASILSETEASVSDRVMAERLAWVRAAATAGAEMPRNVPFSDEELPEALGTLLAMSDINRFSHIVMAGSPVKVPFDSKRVKSVALRMFGRELVPTQSKQVEPGRSLELLQRAELPADLGWASPNPRIARALAQASAAIDREAADLINQKTMDHVHTQLNAWNGEPMPMSRTWVDKEVQGLRGTQRTIARFALLMAKASYQIDDQTNRELLREVNGETNFIKTLGWCSFTSARHLTSRIANNIHTQLRAA